MFQSAPLTKARGDANFLSCGPCTCKFQSAPLTKARGDALPILLALNGPPVSIRSPHKSKGRRQHEHIGHEPQHVSIRSPHKSKGRRSGWCCFPKQSEFQSAPLTKARGDSIRHRVSCPLISFNPLPSQKQGETQRGDDRPSPLAVSIRSPHKSKGRQQGSLDKPLVFRVSIRSPHKSKGRPPTRATSMSLKWFQSAPLTKARGDQRRGDLPHDDHGFNPLPSQKQGETVVLVAFLLVLLGFNPLPSQKQGETHIVRVVLQHILVSIRSPHKSKGRRAAGFQGESVELVSIRSPHKSKGRQARLAAEDIHDGFQSAPLTKARGDGDAKGPIAGKHSFNPLPSQKQGETAWRGGCPAG